MNVRVYVINGINLMPKDKNNLADPYLCVELAGIKKGKREERIEESTQVVALRPLLGSDGPKMTRFF